jgi:3-hydroxymyristoyl/3-hydroxydecanoyl-(acyl carrier protein) dehydratase
LNNITFYDKTAKQKHLFSVKQQDYPLLMVDEIFDLEENPNEYIEFFDVDEEYIDW